MEQIFYIPINSGNLAHYFSKALILPAKYFSNRLEDIQSKLEYSILLSKSKWIKNTDCSIEVILTETELKELKNISDNFSKLNIPLPISRIKKVFFLDKKQKETTVWNINNGAAFIPEHLISIEKDSVEFANNDFILNEISNISNIEIESKINRFNTALGGFAFMKVGGKVWDNISMEFSENYFITLSNFNKLIEEQTLKAEKEKRFSFNRKFIGLFSTNDSEWSKWQPYIYKNIALQNVEEIAEKEGVKIEKELGLIKIDSIEKTTHLYDIAILATYGESKNKSVDDLVNCLHNSAIPECKKEDIALLFGLNTGYTKFRNKYKSNNREYNIKFKLDSKLDFYTIESIFQFAFYQNRKSYAFSYIDKMTFPQGSKKNFKGFETYNILDKTIIAKKKQTPLERFFEKHSMGFYEKLSNSAKQFIPVYATFDNEKAIAHFKSILNDSFILALQQFEKEVLSENEELFIDEKQSLISSYEEKIELLKNEINNSKVTKAETETIKTLSNGNEIKETSVVSESTVLMIPSKDYEKMSLSDLKKVAKEKGIKVFAKATKKDIIELIKNTPPLLL
ncbi:MAG: Rho termination factor N-terminal domain-containing protein [Ignavibacteria bacterium]|nr:Rho termination factor N-terminal domain-containing protein [Ignavibacteria bacterium]